MKTLIKSALVTMLATTSLTAFAYNDSDKAEIEKVVSEIQQGFAAYDSYPFYANISPKVYAAAGVDWAELDKVHQQNPEQSKINQNTFFFAGLDQAEPITTKEDNEYILFPVMYVEDGFVMPTISMAVEEKGRWYINHFDVMDLQKAYPDFSDDYLKDETIERMFEGFRAQLALNDGEVDN